MKLVFLGCGAAARMHAKTLSKIENGHAIVTRFASRDPSRAEAEYGSYEAALADPSVDAVVVTTPPATHLELTLAALSRQKHVIVEKPAFVRSTDFDAVGDAARRAGCRVLVAENYFYKPLTAALRRVIESGVIGDVRFVHVNALKRQISSGWRDDRALAGGGALFEGGIHWINLLSSIGLTIASAHGTVAGPANGDLDRSLLVSLRFAEGAAGTLLYSWEIPSLLRGLRLSRVFGTRGSIVFESNGVFVSARGRISFPGLFDIAGYRAMFRDFLRVLRDGIEPKMTLARARADVALVEQIYRSTQAEGVR